MQTLLGKKIDQAQKFLVDGRRIPVTRIDASGNVVMSVNERDGQKHAQIGFGSRKHVNKPLLGLMKKSGVTKAPSIIKEFPTNTDIAPGQLLHASDVLASGDILMVTGTSKGKGFAGVVRRYNFRGGPKTHGQSDRHRAPGSIGSGTTPGRVYKGKRMAGRMGSDTVSVKNLEVVAVVGDMVYVKGLVPGGKQTVISLTKISTAKTPLELAEPLGIPVSDVVSPEEVAEPNVAEVEDTTNEVVVESPIEVAAEGTPQEQIGEEVKEGEPDGK